MWEVSRKLVPAFFCCALLAAAARAQEPCRIPLSAAPDYGGVRLGMTVAEAREMFPGSRELREEAGRAPRIALGPLDLNIRKEQFAGVDELALGFVEGRLHRIDLTFDPSPDWADVSEFSERLTRRLALPRDSWGPATSSGDRETRTLECRGFAVSARVTRGGPALLSIINTEPAPRPAP